MAWTAPKTWSVSELVTAANMNTHLKNNLRYLKGMDGAVDLEDELKITSSVSRQLTLINSGGTPKSYHAISSTGIGLWDVNRNSASGAIDDTSKSVTRILCDTSGTASIITLGTAAAANVGATERVRITGAGRVGIGRTSPGGLLHGYDTISGFQHYEFDGVDGTARTVIANAAGDVGIGVGGTYVVQHSGGTTRTGIVSSLGDGTAAYGGASGGGNQNIYNVGGNTLQLQVAADGSVTVQRTAGTGTYKVGLWLLWL